MRHIHFMGIGGVGMSGLARWYREEGFQVSGCDLSDSTEVTKLRHEGMTVHLGHSPEHVDGIDLLVSSMAVPETHPEICEARAQGRRAVRRIELLGELLTLRRSIGITGTHGKSTTTGMTASIFLEAELDPSILVGANLPLIASNVHYGRGEHLIAEVDESDPGFAHLRSDLAVITNLEDDHIAGSFSERRNYHASLEELELATKRFATNARAVLYCADWEGLGALLGRGLSYGFSPSADYRIEEAHYGAHGCHFTFVTPTGERVPVTLSVPGKHNILNASAALASAHLYGLDMNRAASSLKGFKGVGRRWQRKGSIQDALIIDDYAHHPTEVGVTLEAARGTGRRVRAVLQPHRWVRTARHWPALADAAGLADEVIVLDIYGAGEAAIPGISADLIVQRLCEAGKMASYHDMASAQAYLSDSLAPNDLIITLGAGDVYKVAEGIIEARGGDDGTA